MQMQFHPAPIPLHGLSVRHSDALDGVWQFIDIPAGLRAPEWVQEARVIWNELTDSAPALMVRGCPAKAQHWHFNDLKMIGPDDIGMAGTVSQPVILVDKHHPVNVKRWGTSFTRWDGRLARQGLRITVDTYLAILADKLSHLQVARVWRHRRWWIEPINPAWGVPKHAVSAERRRAM
jgi:hypothetical protein